MESQYSLIVPYADELKNLIEEATKTIESKKRNTKLYKEIFERYVERYLNPEYRLVETFFMDESKDMAEERYRIAAQNKVREIEQLLYNVEERLRKEILLSSPPSPAEREKYNMVLYQLLSFLQKEVFTHP